EFVAPAREPRQRRLRTLGRRTVIEALEDFGDLVHFFLRRAGPTLIRLRHLLPSREKAIEPRILCVGLLPLWEKVPEGRMRGEPHPPESNHRHPVVRCIPPRQAVLQLPL